LNDQVEMWVVTASHFIGECFDSCKHLLDKDNDTLEASVRYINTQLYIDCHFSSESALILIEEGKDWDADIINRTIIEGTVKYIYMMSCNDKKRHERANEYAYLLPKFSAIRRHERAKKFLDELENSDGLSWKAIEEQLLTEEQIIEYRSGFNVKERKAIEQKWSFNEIVNEFTTSKEEGLELLAHLTYNYRMSNHLIHKDSEGIAVVWDSCTRDSSRQTAMKLGHSARMISDICVLTQLRSMYLLKACGEKDDVFSTLESKYSQFFNELTKASEYFNEIEYGT